MRRSMIAVLGVAAAMLLAAGAVQADITIPTGTLTIPMGDGWRYDYSISSASINAQDVSEAHVTGNVTGYTLPNVNWGWFTIGLITQSERDRALGSGNIGNHFDGKDAYMFNNSVFMMGMKGSAGNVVMPSDYAGDFAGGTGQEQSIGSSFTFDLKLAPNIGGTGGMAYLSINGGAYGTGLAYGTDNWNNYGYTFPAEDLSEAYLIAQIFEPWSATPPTSSVSFENVTATPEPATLSLLALGGLALIRGKRK